MRISAKADYAVRAAIALAAPDQEGPLKGDRISEAQGIPLRFLENILGELRHAGPGPEPARRRGRLLAGTPAPRRSPSPRSSAPSTARWRPSAGSGPRTSSTSAAAQKLQDVWVGLRANIREILETVTLADIVAGELPDPVGEIVDRPEVWESH